jgi:choline transport protein
LAAIVVVTVIPCLLALINIGSNKVLNIVFSLLLAGLFTSYEISAILLLYRRCTGGIVEPIENSTDIANPLEQLTWGPWKIKGVLGIVNNIVACGYLVVIVIFSFFPPSTPVPSLAGMNWSVVMFFGVILLSMVYYFVWARRFYTGPVVEG